MKPLHIVNQISVIEVAIERVQQHIYEYPTYISIYLCCLLGDILAEYHSYIEYHIPLFTRENSSRFDKHSLTNNECWFNGDDPNKNLNRLKFLRWIKSELEKELTNTNKK